MHTAEVIKREPHGVSSLQVLPLLGEGIGQPRHSAHPHANRKVLPFNMRSANPVEFRLSPDWDRYSIHDFGGGVPNFSITGRRVDFNQLGEVYPRSQTCLNGVNVGLESIGGDLELALGGLVDLLGKGEGIAGASPSKMPSEYQLCIALDSDEAVGIPAQGGATDIVLFLAPNKTPYFVALNIGHGEIVDSALQETFALVPDQDEQGKYGGVVDAGNALNGANRAALGQKLYDLGSVLQARVHAAKRCSVVFCEGLAALLTTEALKAVAVLSKLLAAGIAVVTGHEVLLDFSAEKPHNECVTFTCGLRPRLDSAPFSIGVEGGAVLPNYSSFDPQKSFGLRASDSRESTNPLVRFLAILRGYCFHDFSRLNHSLQNHVNRGLRILISAQVMPKLHQFVFHFVGSKSGRVSGFKDSSNFFCKRGVLKHVRCFFARLYFYPLAFTQLPKGLNRFAHDKQALFSLSCRVKQRFEFFLRRFIGTLVIGGFFAHEY